MRWKRTDKGIQCLWLGMLLEITSHVYRTAYAVNGNTGNPTQYKRWDLYIDGKLYLSSLPTLRAAKAEARILAGVETR